MRTQLALILALATSTACAGEASSPVAAPVDDAGEDTGAPEKTAETLAYHSSTAKPGLDLFSPWVMDPSARAEIAVRYLPSVHPTTLTGVRFFANNPTDGPIPFELRIYADRDGHPDETAVLTRANNSAVPSGHRDWLEIPLGLEIARGAFWVSIQWDPPPLASERGANSFFISHDRKLDHGPEHVTRGYDGAWLSFAKAYPIGDLFLQAVVLHD